jgi:hypothetical protein
MKLDRRTVARETFAMGVALIPAIVAFVGIEAAKPHLELHAYIFLSGFAPFSIFPLVYALVRRAPESPASFT